MSLVKKKQKRFMGSILQNRRRGRGIILLGEQKNNLGTWFPFQEKTKFSINFLLYLPTKMALSTVPPYFYKRYLATPETLENTVEKYGVAIIPNVLSEKECLQARGAFWDYLERVTAGCPLPIDPQDPKTYSTFYEMWPKHSMLLQQWGVGHTQALWDLRQNPKIIDIFSKLWGVPAEELLVSFDGASFHIPPEITGKGWLKAEKGWLHTDQGWGKRPESPKPFECIQSWVTVFDVEAGDATLTILEKSHIYHQDLAKTFNLEKQTSDWHLLSEEQQNFYAERGCLQRAIKCPAGSMVFWDSRTIHAGQEPVKGRHNPNFRLVAYLCYTPRAMCSEANRKKRCKAFEEMRTTNHWPHKPKLFAKTPHTYGKPVMKGLAEAELEPPKIGKLAKRLIGY